MNATSSLRVGVLGASGFAGGELVRLLWGHPRAEIAYVGARDSAGRRLSEVHPHLAAAPNDPILEPLNPTRIAGRVDLALCALPHGTSAARSTCAANSSGRPYTAFSSQAGAGCSKPYHSG